MKEVDGHALHRHLDGPGDLALGDTVEGGLFLVHGQHQSCCAPSPGTSRYPPPLRWSAKISLTSVGQLDPAPHPWAVDLGHQGLQHRRAGRHLGHGHGRPVSLGDRGHRRPHPLGNVVALDIAFVLGQEIDLDVGHGRTGAEEVVADQAVEIKGRGGAGIDLVVDHLGSSATTSAISRATRAVCSRVEPSGMSRMIWNSDLLSKGSIFTLTRPK